MQVDENKAVVRKLEAALSSGRVDAGLELFADEITYNGQTVDPQYIRQVRAPLWDAVPDVQWTIEAMVAEGDSVATLWTVTGTHQRAFSCPGLGQAPASGKRIQYRYMVIHRLAGGRIVEAQDVSERLALLIQLGAIEPPDPSGRRVS